MLGEREKSLAMKLSLTSLTAFVAAAHNSSSTEAATVLKWNIAQKRENILNHESGLQQTDLLLSSDGVTAADPTQLRGS